MKKNEKKKEKYAHSSDSLYAPRPPYDFKFGCTSLEHIHFQKIPVTSIKNHFLALWLGHCAKMAEWLKMKKK